MSSFKQIILGITLISFVTVVQKPTAIRAADGCLSPGCQSVFLLYIKIWSWAPAVSCREQTVGYWRYIRCRPTLSKTSGHLWAIEDAEKNNHKVRPVNGKAIGIALQGYELAQPHYPIIVSIGEPLGVESIPDILEAFDK